MTLQQIISLITTILEQVLRSADFTPSETAKARKLLDLILSEEKQDEALADTLLKGVK